MYFTEVHIPTEELSDNKAKLAADKALTEHLQSQLATLEDRLREYQMISEVPKIYDDIYDDNTPTLVRKKKVRELAHILYFSQLAHLSCPPQPLGSKVCDLVFASHFILYFLVLHNYHYSNNVIKYGLICETQPKPNYVTHSIFLDCDIKITLQSNRTFPKTRTS